MKNPCTGLTTALAGLLISAPLLANEPDAGWQSLFDGETLNGWRGYDSLDIPPGWRVEEGTIQPSADANWSFAPLPGTSVLFDTGPKAADYADDVPGVEIAPAGDGPDGFARFRIDL